MDPTQSSIDLTGINNAGACTGTINSGISDDTITLSSYPWSNTVLGGGYSISNLSAANYPNVNITTGSNIGPYTISGGAGTNANPWSYNASPKIQLDGEDADVVINGISLLKTMQEIQSRLNLLQPNTALEAEWEELYALGKKYRELEQQIKDKQATWDRLKAMPPPAIE